MNQVVILRCFLAFMNSLLNKLGANIKTFRLSNGHVYVNNSKSKATGKRICSRTRRRLKDVGNITNPTCCLPNGITKQPNLFVAIPHSNNHCSFGNAFELFFFVIKRIFARLQYFYLGNTLNLYKTLWHCIL